MSKVHRLVALESGFNLFVGALFCCTFHISCKYLKVSECISKYDLPEHIRAKHYAMLFIMRCCIKITIFFNAQIMR